MKKAYMKPQMEACKMEVENLICASGPGMKGSSGGGGGLGKENMFDVDDTNPLW